jgi:hypothetical protein
MKMVGAIGGFALAVLSSFSVRAADMTPVV